MRTLSLELWRKADELAAKILALRPDLTRERIMSAANARQMSSTTATLLDAMEAMYQEEASGKRIEA